MSEKGMPTVQYCSAREEVSLGLWPCLHIEEKESTVYAVGESKNAMKRRKA